MIKALISAVPAGRSRSNLVELPARRRSAALDSIQEVVFELATAPDLATGIRSLLEWLQRTTDVTRVEWWIGDGGGRELVASAGTPRPMRHNLRLGPAGVLVLHGGQLDSEVEAELMSLTPILRRRAAEERLTRTAMQLARRNEALEDFAALVAHELKTPLQAALIADDPSGPVQEALELVEAVLEATHDEPGHPTFASVDECLDRAVEDLRADVAVTSDLATTLPLAPAPLRVILRNLLANAVAAGAQHVHVTAERSTSAFRLLVEDDGVGLVDDDRYASGSGLGFSLCRRIAGRFGGVLRLEPLAFGGTRATLELAEVPR